MSLTDEEYQSLREQNRSEAQRLYDLLRIGHLRDRVTRVEGSESVCYEVNGVEYQIIVTSAVKR